MPSRPIMVMYIHEIGRIDALPKVAAETMPPLRDSEPAPPAPLPKGEGRKAARCDLTAHGPTPGPPPPCGMQKVLCRLRCETSEPQRPGRAMPHSAFKFAPSVYTCPPCWWTMSQIVTISSSNTPWVDG